MGTVNQPQRPAETIRAGGVKATIWENKTKDDNVYYSVSLTRSYKDGDEWKESNSYYRDDLPKVELVMRKAFEWIHLEADRHHERSNDKDNGQMTFAEKIEGERAGKGRKTAAASAGK